MIGRRFLREHRAVLNFITNRKTLNGISSNFAHKIPLGALDVDKSAEKHVGALAGTNGIGPESTSEEPLAVSTTTPEGQIVKQLDEDRSKGNQSGTSRRGGESVRKQTCEEAWEDARKMLDRHDDVKHNKLCNDFETAGQYDCGCCDFNVFNALESGEGTFPEREVEDAIVRGWISGMRKQDETIQSKDRPGTGNGSPSELLPALRNRVGNDLMVPSQTAQELNLNFPSPVWFIKAGFLRRLHMLRHAPSKKMIDFVWACVPEKAKRQSQRFPGIEIFRKNLERYCDAVVKRCIGCALHGKAVSRPISLSIVPPLKIGMLDTMCLDYAKRWYALVIADLGSGMCWAFPIYSPEGKDPTGEACIVTYMTRYAVHYGPHKIACCDRDSIFSGTKTTGLWQQLGVERESVGSFAHFSMGMVERRIGMFRWSIDRVRTETPPNTLTGWELVLGSIGNAFFNEQDFTGTSPSQRITGYQTSLLRNALTDSPTTGTADHPNMLIAERSMMIYQHARADMKLRRMLASHLPAGTELPIFPSGTRVAYYREAKGAERQTYRGPAQVLGYSDTGKYILEENGRYHFMDRAHVKPWPDQPDSLRLDVAVAPPMALSRDNAPDEERQLVGSHPMDRVEPQASLPAPPTGDAEGLELGSLIHDKTVAQNEGEIICGRCLGERGLGGNQKHGHSREPGCTRYKPDDPKTWSSRLKALAEAAAKTLNKQTPEETVLKKADPKLFADTAVEQTPLGSGRDSEVAKRNPNQRQRKKKREIEYTEVSHTTVNGHKVTIMTKADLQNDIVEDLKFLEEMIERVYVSEELPDPTSGGEHTTESKYLYTWDQLSEEKKKNAFKKAVEAYDNHKSWFRGSELSEQDFRKFQRQNPSVVGMDCTLVLDAKLKNGEIIGKVRIAPRGFRDHTDKARWYSTSPTASSVSVRISELLGMKWGLESWVFDISDAFFSGELLRDDEFIYIKVPAQIIQMEGGDPSKPWRRLRREVPGCKGASSSWFRTLCTKLTSWGYEQLTTDPAFFVKRDSKTKKVTAMLPVHVDDGKLRATQAEADALFAHLEKDPSVKLSSKDKQKLGEPVDFIGLAFTETKAGTTIDQNVYIKNKLAAVDATALRAKDADEQLGAADMKVYGTCVGRLIWLLPTQVKYSYEISFLSRFRAYPRVKHMRRIAALIQTIKKDPQYLFLPRFHREVPIKLMAVVDAGAGEEADPPLKTRDHQCVALLLVAPVNADADSIPPGVAVRAGLLSWQSCGVSRVSHASFDFEAISAVSSLDHLFNVKELVGEVLLRICPNIREREARQAWRDALPVVELHSDSMGLVKAVRLGVTQSLSSRRRRDVLDLRDCMQSGDLNVFMHIDGKTNPTDVGTKCNARTIEAQKELTKIIHDGHYHPRPSKNHGETFGAAFCFDDLEDLGTLFPQLGRARQLP